MRRIIFLTIALTAVLSLNAQPTKTRKENDNSRNAQQQEKKVDRAGIMFPTAVAMPEDVAWRRDVYKELDLRKDANAPLYYPETPKDGEQNLFYTLFRLLNVGMIPAYNYKTDGTEHFDRANRMHFKDMLDRYEIFYRVDSARRAINVNDSDIPGNEVLSYFVKESSYYDQNTATYHSRIVALCPVLHRAAVEFSYESMTDDDQFMTKYPMFWVKFDDIEPYISKQMVMVSNINNASKMSVADFLATNKYEGTIYMTTNMQNKAIMDYCKTDSAVVEEQKRLEKEMSDFEEHIWSPPVDSATLAKRDSIAAAAAEKKSKKSRRQRTEKVETVDNDKTASTNKDNDGNQSEEPKKEKKSRISARRERH